MTTDQLERMHDVVIVTATVGEFLKDHASDALIRRVACDLKNIALDAECCLAGRYGGLYRSLDDPARIARRMAAYDRSKAVF